MTLIDAFEVPPEADEAFVAAWRRARDLRATRAGFGATALHRALRPDVPFRFVAVARVDSPDAWRAAVSDPAFPGGEMPFASHPGLYEVVHEDGVPDGADGVVLIDVFEVDPAADERFVAGWDAACRVLGEQRGYLGTRLHRSVGPADFRFVAIARWSSPLMFSRALAQPRVQEAAGALPFPSHPALYQAVDG